MKRYVIGGALLLVACLSADSRAENGFRLGARLGANFPSSSISSALRTDGSPSESTALCGGLATEADLNNTWSLTADYLFVRRQTTMVFSSANNLPAIRAKYTLDFLEIPIMVRATLGWGAVRPYLFAGPNFGIRLKASSDNTSAGGSQSYNVKDQIGSTNVSIEVGAGVGYKFAENTTLTGDARYSYGLVNLSRTDGDSWKTRDVRVMIGLLFRL